MAQLWVMTVCGTPACFWSVYMWDPFKRKPLCHHCQWHSPDMLNGLIGEYDQCKRPIKRPVRLVRGKLATIQEYCTEQRTPAIPFVNRCGIHGKYFTPRKVS